MTFEPLLYLQTLSVVIQPYLCPSVAVLLFLQ